MFKRGKEISVYDSFLTDMGVTDERKQGKS